MSVSSPEPVLHRQLTIASPERRALARERRPWLLLRTALAAVQLSCVTLVGWIGATLTLLPLAVRGGPAGRSVWVAPRAMHLLEPAPADETPDR